MSEIVLVLGAGFTRGFLPTAPLMIDDYGANDLIHKFERLEHARRLLEIYRLGNGHINIENLLTRLNEGMPYESEIENHETKLLASAIKHAFARRLAQARQETPYLEELSAFAKCCVNRQITCVTFNYDDVLDRALWEVHKIYGEQKQPKYWHPECGYGFAISPLQIKGFRSRYRMNEIAMFLYKLHGSVNWRVEIGERSPYRIGALKHVEEWYPEPTIPVTKTYTEADIELELETDPFIIPPVLMKTSLALEPTLKLVWD